MNPKKAREGIFVQGAREHNLKSIDVFIPRNKLTVITGLSGSGKSSLAFDTLFAEGQRRYIESLSTYARYFMEKLKNPDVDSIFGLCPVVAIDQKTITPNPRSTVGTITETYDYLRLLFAKLGAPRCPKHQEPLIAVPPEMILKNILKMKKGQRFQIFSPVVQAKKGELSKEIQKYVKMGWLKAKIDGVVKTLDPSMKLNKRKMHNMEILIDDLFLQEKFMDRIEKSLKKALELSSGLVLIQEQGLKKPKQYSIHASCSVCLYSCPELEPRLFSFNSSQGACPQCKGLGFVDEDEGRWGETYYIDASFWDEENLDICPSCRGMRLSPPALSVFVGGKNIAEVSGLEIAALGPFLKKLKWKPEKKIIAEKIIEKILQDLEVLSQVGVSYLSLSRTTHSLSGGEAQRIRLAGQISSTIVGVLYILDEPSIGLHPSNHKALLDLIEQIKKKQNTIIIVEHDEQTIMKADHLIDIGPGAGTLGGKLVFQGPLQNVMKNKKSLTGDYLAKRKTIPIPQKRRQSQKFLHIHGARGHNLKNVNVKIPIGVLVSVTGVSGSGKSSLVVDTLFKALSNKIYRSGYNVLPYKGMKGASFIEKAVTVNQKPIGKTSRSVPATYVGVMSLIRDFMAALPLSKMRGYQPGHFSFNTDKKGRCPACQGMGLMKQEMHFLSHTFTLCEICQGRRYTPDILKVTYKNKNISDILNMTVKKALTFFENHPLIYTRLKMLDDVGLSYLTLGQSSSSLSGGEAQRIKLTKELSKKRGRRALYVLDEPTTGLHFEDIKKLLKVLSELVDRGHSIIVIEHNMDVIKCSDYVVDLGPGGGRLGGRVLAQGTPEEVVRVSKSLTGAYLKKALSSS